jgi:hypothetical protein
MTPNQVLNKVTALQLRNDVKSRALPSSPTHSALACKQVKKLKKMAIKGSSSAEKKKMQEAPQMMKSANEPQSL